jgi:hypothetical protein
MFHENACTLQGVFWRGIVDLVLPRWPANLNLPPTAPQANAGNALPIATATATVTVAGQTLSGKIADAKSTSIMIRANACGRS